MSYHLMLKNNKKNVLTMTLCWESIKDTVVHSQSTKKVQKVMHFVQCYFSCSAVPP